MKDMTVYFGVDGEFYDYKDVPRDVTHRVWKLLEPYRVIDKDKEREDLVSDVAEATEVFNEDELERFAKEEIEYCKDKLKKRGIE
jgi:hypothetical protein